MTTNPKTRKAAAKASPAKPAEKATAPNPEPKESSSEDQREVSEIRRLLSRWKWLEADQVYQAEMAPTEDEAERLIAIHNDEQKDIEGKLAELVPKTISEIDDLLEFATNLVQNGCMIGGANIAMLRNIRTGLRGACRAEMDRMPGA